MDLHEFAQATADASGRAVAYAGPAKFGDVWEVELINSNTTSTAQSELRVFRGVESDTTRLIASYSGNSDTAGGGSTITVRAGDKLVFVWSGADPGAICTARIEGQFVTGRR